LPLLAVDGEGGLSRPFNFMAIDVLSVVSIEELRQHLEFDSNDRDAVIKRYAQAALEHCLNGVMSRTGRKLMTFLHLLFRPCC
jgi:hypothetical protein